MRYIKIPDSVRCIDVATEKETTEIVSFAKAVSMVCAGLVAKQLLDTLDVIALRSAINGAKVGDEVAVDSVWWDALQKEFKRTNTLGTGYLLVAGPHIRAVLDAKEAPSPKTEEKTVAMADQANGASATAAS